MRSFLSLDADRGHSFKMPLRSYSCGIAILASLLSLLSASGHFVSAQPSISRALASRQYDSVEVHIDEDEEVHRREFFKFITVRFIYGVLSKPIAGSTVLC